VLGTTIFKYLLGVFLKNTSARFQWLMTTILATWEVDIKKIVAQDQLGQIVPKIPK
jgi:hypothetical protein